MKNRRKKKQIEKSVLGRIVDMSLEDFEKELVKQKVNIGVINNLIMLLSATYHDLVQRKDGVLDLVFKGEKKKEEVQPIVEGLYAEMTKLEQKITLLKEKSKKLLDLDNTTS